ncbi:MAG: hypothetical protein RL518_260 [Pseudomonadota bacterium]|jgi:hypothetical protein
MSLDTVIKPEIVNDEFHRLIQTIAATQPLNHILEIGSSSGEGSTDAWVKGIVANPQKPTLHCIECSKPRFQKLSAHYAGNPQVKCYWASSVALSQFPSPEQVAEFYTTQPSNLRQYPLQQVLGWLKEDVEYVRTHKAPEDGIAQALRASGQSTFDAVLIDGSEFTGVPEFAAIYGATIIMLDDITTYKNWEVMRYLSGDSRYRLIYSRDDLRNGFALFCRQA